MVSVVVYNILWAKSRRLRVKYTVFYCTLWTNWVHCPLSLLQNIYTSTKLKYCPLSVLDIISLWRLSHDCSILPAWLSVVGSTAGGVGIQRTPVLSWKVGGGGGVCWGQSPTCECYRLIVSESVY